MLCCTDLVNFHCQDDVYIIPTPPEKIVAAAMPKARKSNVLILETSHVGLKNLTFAVFSFSSSFVTADFWTPCWWYHDATGDPTTTCGAVTGERCGCGLRNRWDWRFSDAKRWNVKRNKKEKRLHVGIVMYDLVACKKQETDFWGDFSKWVFSFAFCQAMSKLQYQAVDLTQLHSNLFDPGSISFHLL